MSSCKIRILSAPPPTSSTLHCNQPCNLQLLHAIAVGAVARSQTCTSQLAGNPSLARQEMQANAKPAAAPSDGAPSSEYPALNKMTNQHTRLSQARPEEPASTKLDDQHNTQAMPVRTRTTAAAQSPQCQDGLACAVSPHALIASPSNADERHAARPLAERLAGMCICAEALHACMQCTDAAAAGASLLPKVASTRAAICTNMHFNALDPLR